MALGTSYSDDTQHRNSMCYMSVTYTPQTTSPPTCLKVHSARCFSIATCLLLGVGKLCGHQTKIHVYDAIPSVARKPAEYQPPQYITVHTEYYSRGMSSPYKCLFHSVKGPVRSVQKTARDFVKCFSRLCIVQCCISGVLDCTLRRCAAVSSFYTKKKESQKFISVRLSAKLVFG